MYLHGSPIKQELTFENSFALIVSLMSLWSFFIFINFFNKRLLSAIAAFLVGLLFYFTKRFGYPAGYLKQSGNIFWKNRSPVSASITTNMEFLAPEGVGDVFDFGYQFFKAGSMFYDTTQDKKRSEKTIVIAMAKDQVNETNYIIWCPRS
ncbi:MAG: hypothetical protein H7328_01590 [Bdellovibrio sp.]|nr:hypothetical protein [Bdellovibrio sp.]